MILFQAFFESKWIAYDESSAINSSLKTMRILYKGNFWRIILAIMFCFIKSSPIWVLPIICSNIVNFATGSIDQNIQFIWQNLFIASIIIFQNIPFHMLYVKLFSRAARYVEAGLRSTLIRKLQQLSISFHNKMESGKIQSKVLRGQFLFKDVNFVYKDAE